MNRPSNILVSILTSGALLFCVGQVGAAQNPQPAADNTKINERDRAKSEPTADQAKETTSDRETMQKIRKAIMADKSLSTYGHNVKVISEHGKVTLKGPVHTAEERTNIEAKAIEVAGTGNVVNELSVKGGSNNRK
jgi:osmotically-inducible protein OsmY